MRTRTKGKSFRCAVACFFAAALLLGGGLASAEMVIVEDGEARAEVVIASEPTPVAEYAAEELVAHIEKATGVQLTMVGEDEAAGDLSRIYVGDTQAAREEGLEPDELPADVFRLRTGDGDLYVLGREDGGDPLEAGALAGTMYGVSELLQRYVGVRWLWPGELGAYVPQTETLTIEAPLDEEIEPAFRFRQFRWHRIRWAAGDYDPDFEPLDFTEEGVQRYHDDLERYLHRHRIGHTESKPPVGHYFTSWWQEHGEEHPEWFMQRADGERGPEDDASDWDQRHVPMCVSNPDLHRYIVEEDWDGGPHLRLGEVDRRAFCQCDDCLAWDEPQPEDPPEFAPNLYNPQVVSGRYARFWKTIRDKAAEHNPDVTVTTFLYWNYLPAPKGDFDLSNVYGEFVPWGQSEVTYFPLEEDAYAWVQDQWRGWEERNVTMAYRPNYFHGGYVMPHISTWQAGEFFQFAHEHGMVGFDYDSLYGHWAAQGLMLYVHMRLFVDPERPIEAIRKEYFEAFGPAAEHVERYFDYWEDYAYERPGGPLATTVRAHVAYPPDVFPPAEEILEEAHEAAEESARSEYAERVAFLQAGLEHARLAAQLMGALDNGSLPDTEEGRAEAREALNELVEFRRAHEDLYIADYNDAARRESRWTDVDALWEDE